jgi:ABC-2 type transport system permease protein
MISPRRIVALMQQEWYISKRSLEVIMDIPFFSAIDVVLFGFVSAYLLGSADDQYGQYLLLGAILWEVIRVTQYSMTVSSMWNVWSRNLSNLFIAPISLAEFIIAAVISAVWKSTVITFGLAGLAYLLFQFNLFAMGVPALLWYSFNLALFSCSVGLVLLGLIFRYGTRIQALAWASIFLIQPTPLQWLAYTMPPTYFFEAARTSLDTGMIDSQTWLWPFLLNVVYAVGGLLIFHLFYQQARRSGQLARLEN